MRTGIDFFEQHEPKRGDLWIVASGPGMGKSTLLRNLAVGIAEHEEGQIIYWDLEQTHAAWTAKIQKMGCSVPAAFLYRNDSPYDDGIRDGLDLVERFNQAAGSQTVAVVIDHFDLFMRGDQDSTLKTFKSWLVRTGRFGLVSMSLPRPVWGQFFREGCLNPDAVPDLLLDNGDAVFVSSKASQASIDKGGADTLRVLACKTPTGLRAPHIEHAFVWEHQSGRIL